MLMLSKLLTDAKGPIVDIYRVAAESVYYQITVLSAFLEKPPHYDWVEYDLFSTVQDSPILGGLHEGYRILNDINHLHIGDRRSAARLQNDLDRLEDQISLSPTTCSTASVYANRHRCLIVAMKLLLLKTADPTICCSDVAEHFRLGLFLLRQNVAQPGNPAMTLPLVIFACAAESDEDFQHVVTEMMELAPVTDKFSRLSLMSACRVLTRERKRSNDQLQYLLMLHKLNDGL